MLNNNKRPQTTYGNTATELEFLERGILTGRLEYDTASGRWLPGPCAGTAEQFAAIDEIARRATRGGITPSAIITRLSAIRRRGKRG